MSTRSLSNLSFDLDFVSYKLRMDWNGPAGSSTVQRDRIAVVRDICGAQAFNTNSLDAALFAPNAQIAYMNLVHVASNDFDALPAKLQQFFMVRGRRPSLQRDTSVPAAFYIYREDQPCVLQYMCLSRTLKGLDLGRYVFKAYEQWVRSTRNCSRIVLAAIDSEKLIDFYRARGFRTTTPPTRGPTTVNVQDERGLPLSIDVPPDTMLMVKVLNGQTTLLPDTPPQDVVDTVLGSQSDDDDRTAVLGSQPDDDRVAVLGSQPFDGERDDDVSPLVDIRMVIDRSGVIDVSSDDDQSMSD